MVQRAVKNAKQDYDSYAVVLWGGGWGPSSPQNTDHVNRLSDRKQSSDYRHASIDVEGKERRKRNWWKFLSRV